MDFVVQFLPLTVVLLVAGAIWYFSHRRSRSRPATEKLQGIRGWLMLLAIVQCGAILRVLFDVHAQYSVYEKYGDQPPMRTAIIGQVGLGAGMIAFMIYTAVIMINKRRIWPALFRIELVLLTVLPLLKVLWVWQATGVPLDELDPGAIIGQCISIAVGAAIWITYTYKSVRVRNTFVH